jgi:hypothetical protein
MAKNVDRNRPRFCLKVAAVRNNTVVWNIVKRNHPDFDNYHNIRTFLLIPSNKTPISLIAPLM